MTQRAQGLNGRGGAAPALAKRTYRDVEAKLAGIVGGGVRLRVIVLLALIVGLEAADNGTVGALVVPLKHQFHISNTQVGLLVTVSTVTGLLATLPAGVLADRVNRTRLLWGTILLWSVAMVFAGFSTGYVWLLACRIVLGAVVAVAGPVVASLLGDYFRITERGRIYGYVLAGEGICTAMGLEVSGGIAAVSWRLGFWWLAGFGIILAVAVAKRLPEPTRASHIGPAAGERDNSVAEVVTARHVRPHPASVLAESPVHRSLWWAVRYVLSIRTNGVLILASSLGYFFFTGLGTFGVALLRGRFQLGQAPGTLLVGVVGIGALIGALSTGRVADALIGRGHISSRMTVAGAAFVFAAALCLPALLIKNLAAAVIFAFLGAIGLGGVNPPLDAGRLDLMHSRLWGRAEAVRTTLRSVATAISPLLFGYVSGRLGGGGLAPQHATVGGSTAQPVAAQGLDETFLIMLVPLFIGGALILLVARRTYPRDVATAIASERAIKRPAARSDQQPTEPIPGRAAAEPAPGGSPAAARSTRAAGSPGTAPSGDG